MKYIIVGDSSTNLNSNECNKFNAKIAPLIIRLDDIEYIDNKNLDIDGLVEHLSRSENIAKTSCPSTQSYLDLFEGDYDNIFVITLSDKLSGSYNTAVLAANMFKETHPKTNIHVFNSKAAATSQYLLVKKIDELIKQDFSFDEIVMQGEDYINSMRLMFLLDDLSNLEKNGRLSTLQATVAKMLNLKLILRQDEHGQIAFGTKARGTKKAIAKLVESMAEYKKICKDTKVAIFHCAAYEKAKMIKDGIEKMYEEITDIDIVQMFGLNSTYAQIGGIIITF